MLTNGTVDLLVARAIEARERSYAPYSHFAVGAALLTKDGKCYTGANIESASFTPTVCAERVALQTAVHAGERDFAAIAIVGGAASAAPTGLCAPCGVCRQMLAEFCDDTLPVILAGGGEVKIVTLGELLPYRFDL